MQRSWMWELTYWNRLKSYRRQFIISSLSVAISEWFTESTRVWTLPLHEGNLLSSLIFYAYDLRHSDWLPLASCQASGKTADDFLIHINISTSQEMGVELLLVTWNSGINYVPHRKSLNYINNIFIHSVEITPFYFCRVSLLVVPSNFFCHSGFF